jgi:acyl carrier protein
MNEHVRDAATLRDWLVTRLATILGQPKETIDTSWTFNRFGLDSGTAIGLTEELSAWIGVELDAMVLYDHPTIDRLVAHLVTGSVRGAS